LETKDKVEWEKLRIKITLLATSILEKVMIMNFLEYKKIRGA